jgi:Flp pilus assembly protein TadD
MRIRVCVLAAIASFALAGCSSPGKSGLWSWGEDTPPPANAAAAGSNAEVTGSSAEVTGSIGRPAAAAPDPLAVKDAMLGGDPGDDVSLGKRHYRERNYGLAEQHFRRAAEKLPRDGEAWLGLAASYDRLRRYELADRAYKQALAIYGPRPEVLNNIGYSLMLRGDLRRARAKFIEAQARDPENPTIANNIALVDEAAKRRKGLN